MTNQEIKQIERMYLIDKLPVQEIADKMFFGKREIYKQLKKLNIPRRKKYVRDKLDIEVIRRLYHEEKLNLKEIAELYDVCLWSIYNFMKLHNIPLRKKGKQKNIDNIQNAI